MMKQVRGENDIKRSIGKRKALGCSDYGKFVRILAKHVRRQLNTDHGRGFFCQPNSKGPIAATNFKNAPIAERNMPVEEFDLRIGVRGNDRIQGRPETRLSPVAALGFVK